MLVEINPHESTLTPAVDVFLQQSAAAGVPDLVKRVVAGVSPLAARSAAAP